MAALLAFCFLVQDDTAVQDAIARFKSAYRSPAPAARATAVTELARTPHEKTLQRLMPLLSGDVKEVRVAAVKALAAFSEHKRQVVPTLLNMLASTVKEPDVSAAVLAALGKLKDGTALPAVVGKFRREHITVAKAAVACAGAIGTRDGLQGLHELLKDLQKWLKKGNGGGYYDDSGVGDEAAQGARLQALKDELVKAFQAVSQESWTTLQEWEHWYKIHKDDPKFRK